MAQITQPSEKKNTYVKTNGLEAGLMIETVREEVRRQLLVAFPAHEAQPNRRGYMSLCH